MILKLPSLALVLFADQKGWTIVSRLLDGGESVGVFIIAPDCLMQTTISAFSAPYWVLPKDVARRQQAAEAFVRTKLEEIFHEAEMEAAFVEKMETDLLDLPKRLGKTSRDDVPKTIAKIIKKRNRYMSP